MSKEEIMAAIQGRAAELGYAPTFTEMRRIAKLNKHLIRKHFLTYERALAECGLARSGPGYTTSAKTLFTDWAELARKLGKVHESFNIEQRFRDTQSEGSAVIQKQVTDFLDLATMLESAKGNGFFSPSFKPTEAI